MFFLLFSISSSLSVHHFRSPHPTFTSFSLHRRRLSRSRLLRLQTIFNFASNVSLWLFFIDSFSCLFGFSHLSFFFFPCSVEDEKKDLGNIFVSVGFSRPESSFNSFELKLFFAAFYRKVGGLEQVAANSPLLTVAIRLPLSLSPLPLSLSLSLRLRLRLSRICFYIFNLFLSPSLSLLSHALTLSFYLYLRQSPSLFYPQIIEFLCPKSFQICFNPRWISNLFRQTRFKPICPLSFLKPPKLKSYEWILLWRNGLYLDQTPQTSSLLVIQWPPSLRA